MQALRASPARADLGHQVERELQAPLALAAHLADPQEAAAALAPVRHRKVRRHPGREAKEAPKAGGQKAAVEEAPQQRRGRSGHRGGLQPEEARKAEPRKGRKVEVVPRSLKKVARVICVCCELKLMGLRRG